MSFVRHADRRHDLPRRAETALKAVMGDECGLHRVEIFALRHTFDGENVRAVGTQCQDEAGIDPPPVNQNGAGSALAAVTALFRAGEVKPFAQQIEQGSPGIVQRDRPLLAIDCQND